MIFVVVDRQHYWDSISISIIVYKARSGSLGRDNKITQIRILKVLFLGVTGCHTFDMRQPVILIWFWKPVIRLIWVTWSSIGVVCPCRRSYLLFMSDAGCGLLIILFSKTESYNV